jgi:putative transposase
MATRYPNSVARLTDPAPANYREVALSRDAHGHYSASCVTEQPDAALRIGGVVAFGLGIKTLATGVNAQGRMYHVDGFKGYQWYNSQLDKIRSTRPLPEEIKEVHPPQSGLPACLGAQAQQTT